MKRKKGEFVTLLCTRCNWSTELPLSATEESTKVACQHCGSPIYWHSCSTCGMKYVGTETPSCPICDGDGSLDDVSFD